MTVVARIIALLAPMTRWTMSIDLVWQQTCTTHCCHLSNYTTHRKTRKHTAINKKDKKDVPKSPLYHSYVPKTSCTEMDIFMYRSIPNKNLCTEVICTEIVMYRKQPTPTIQFTTLLSHTVQSKTNFLLSQYHGAWCEVSLTTTYCTLVLCRFQR